MPHLLSAKNLPLTAVLASIALFFAFGLFHLGKFETVDEHFWKYERIPQYWQGIREGFTKGDWKKTRINDKPGVTVALISGAGLLVEPHPETHRLRDNETTADNVLTAYDATRTEKINVALRLPILFFATGAFFLFFWIIRVVARGSLLRAGLAAEEAGKNALWIAAASVALMATSPVLVGISQMLNPDALLWVCMPFALLAYFALLETGAKKFLWWCGIATGLALLSKYTANLLFPLYAAASFGFLLFSQDILTVETVRIFLRQQWKNFWGIVILSAGVFALFLPAVFQKPKHFLNGTIFSPALEPLLWPMAVLLLFWAADGWIFQGRMTALSIRQFRRMRQSFVTGIALLTLVFFGLVFMNVALDGKWVPLDDLKEQAYVDGDLTFPMFDDGSAPLRLTKKIIAEMQMLPFSFIPIHLTLIIGGWIWMLLGGFRRFAFYAFFLSALWWIWIFGALFSGVFLTYRYAIILYPLAALFGALTLSEILSRKQGSLRNPTPYYFAALLLIIFSGAYALAAIKPHYLNYTNMLLPREYVFVDAWGYGEYEAAEYLNSLPDAQDLIVWSDRSALCQFILGRCVRDYRIDLNQAVPDYFVFSRRGSIRHKFEWRFPELARQSNLAYYTDTSISGAVWRIDIGGREKNYVIIVKSLEK